MRRRVVMISEPWRAFPAMASIRKASHSRAAMPHYRILELVLDVFIVSHEGSYPMPVAAERFGRCDLFNVHSRVFAYLVRSGRRAVFGEAVRVLLCLFEGDTDNRNVSRAVSILQFLTMNVRADSDVRIFIVKNEVVGRHVDQFIGTTSGVLRNQH